MRYSVDYIKEIETKYSVENIKYNGIPIWPILREYISKEILNKNKYFSGNNSISINIVTISILIKNIFFGISNLTKFRKFNYWGFSNSERRKEVNKKYYDRVVDGVSANFSNTIIFENPIPNGHIKHKHLAYKNVTGDSILNLFVFTIYSTFFLFKKIRIENFNVLESIYSDYCINVNHNKLIKKFYGQTIVCQFLLKIKKPFAVFMVNPPSYFGYIYTLKKVGVPIIELQHGIFNEKHINYNCFKDLKSPLVPDYLFTYGKMFLKYFSKSNFYININNVKPIGYYFLELISNTKDYDKELDILIRKYETSIAFSSISQSEIELPFLIQLALSSEKLLIIYIPRKPLKKQITIMPNNLIFWHNTNIYRVIQACDIHSTITSTTAIEATFLKKPTIFYDFENRSYNYYKDILSKETTFYAKTIDTYNYAIEQIKNSIRNIDYDSSQIFCSNYSNNIKNSINDIIK